MSFDIRKSHIKTSTLMAMQIGTHLVTRFRRLIEAEQVTVVGHPAAKIWLFRVLWERLLVPAQTLEEPFERPSGGNLRHCNICDVTASEMNEKASLRCVCRTENPVPG